jgi:hypothetical protein
MLRAPSGATIAAMAHATGWQQHSLRGFLAGVVRKKLGLNLVSAAGESGRLYRITDWTVSPEQIMPMLFSSQFSMNRGNDLMSCPCARLAATAARPGDVLQA